jgi:succinate-semialdehyde dehydrogenase / glutarate-semialdehyde dehydrogenase
MEQSAGTVKKLSLELGGNAPFILFDDADFEMAVKSLPLRRQWARLETCRADLRLSEPDSGAGGRL